MQESEARAYFLRDMRKAKNRVEKFYRDEHEFGSKKHVLQFLDDFRLAHDGITIFEYRKPTRHPWHFNHTFFYIEPKAIEEDGIGKLLLVQQTTLDSKKLVKGDLSDILEVQVTRDLVLHEHFFTRLIQRGELSGLKAALKLTAHSLAEVLVQIKFAQTQFDEGQTLHLVFPDKVFIVTCERGGKLLIFKTVILAEFMTERQTGIYGNAIARAMKAKNGFVFLKEDHQDFELITQ